ncbi:hypothetical protein BGM26_08845 [Bacillus sp. FJAT-29790]|uniref:hypothetical protein n=1 Tax=Bacillus sp. FJAT-29790 TaxID=1895002 RepID=UPI001C24215A|nr:hypothetical protein [Bacillus sp. FJAT-29790]MBU8879090.1 hypothetical protein [Bacillus sp. FJAT-29790]
MTYIIENANILKDQEINKVSLLIDNGKITAIKPIFNRYRFMKMDADPFIMAPAPILLNKNFPFEKSFQEMKKFFIDEFILKGCIAFLTMASVGHEYAMEKEIKRVKTQLLNSPIDYIIGVRVPIRTLTPSFLRKCKREKVPAVFVEIKNANELYNIPWGWIREAIFPYNSPLIPIFSSMNEREEKQAKTEWKKVMGEEKIPSVKDEIKENEPIPYPVLSKIGIFPLKSSIQQGRELSYNLYMKSGEIINIEEPDLFHYHRHKLVVTVHKGEVIRACDHVVFRPGFGEHVKINIPSFFTT